MGLLRPLWEDRLSELADYRKIHGHCNVPHSYSDNLKLGQCVAHQRSNCKLHVKRKTLSTTPSRFHALESLGFEWKPSIGRGKGTLKTPSLDDDARRVHKTSAKVNLKQGLVFSVLTCRVISLTPRTTHHAPRTTHHAPLTDP
jgi:hypothetical protein